MADPFARFLRGNPTDPERILWQRLRRRQISGHRFRRQRPIGSYVVDFVCLERRVIVEVDGGQHAERACYDANRSSWLSSHGFRVLRFWNHDVLARTDSVCEAIRQVLDEEEGVPPS